MSKWSDVWPRGVPQAPAIRLQKQGLRMTRELFEAMGRPSYVDIVFRPNGDGEYLAIRPGHRYRVRAHPLDHAMRVNSRPLGAIVADESKGEWLLAEGRDGVWVVPVRLRGVDDA